MQTFSMQSLTWAVVILSSFWVLMDAKAIGVRKGLVRGLGNLSPAGWFLACLLLWFPAFFLYLFMRPKFKHALAEGPAVAKRQPVASSEAVMPTHAPRQAAGWGMNGVQALVWGVLCVVAGLGLTGWSGWQSYQDISTWVQARGQLQEIDALTPEKLAQAKQDAAQSDNPLEQFVGGFLFTPEMMNVARIKAQSDMQTANANLQTELPLLLLGLGLVYGGHRLLGRARSRAER